MAKELFNEAELYLVRQWPSAQLMEESMDKVRKKYASLCQRTVEAFQATHKELDNSQVFVTQFWASGYAGTGRVAWRHGKGNPGFYIDNLRLEVLTDETEEAPYAYIWLDKPQKGSVDFAKARKTIQSAASKLLTQEELRRCSMDDPDEGCPLYYDLPESRHDLLGMLTEADGQRFADCLTAHMELLARFTPVLDEILLKGNAAKQ
ncbi:MAG: hypothetical protein NTX87_07250 [Planctomycetota bacterium]|nr:hypothetical protein [Planctomycetota bacterium]